MTGGRKRTLGLAVTALAVFGAGQALAATETITATQGGVAYDKPTFALDPGQVATFQNLSSSQHDVTATGRGPDGDALFSSATIGTGQTPVNGTQYLGPGSYQFFCTIHPEMRSDLAVGPGSPLPRPAISIKVLSKKLGKVVSSRKLKLRVTAEGAAEDVDLVARKGAKRLGSKGSLSLADGSSRKVNLRLTNSGRRAIDDLDSAKVKVTGTVDFGSPETARRKLK